MKHALAARKAAKAGGDLVLGPFAYLALPLDEHQSQKSIKQAFQADSDRTVSVAPQKPKCSDDDPLFVLGQ